jgi:metal-responsive CopG/Arc/MetJ family transcriptional regulator
MARSSAARRLPARKPTRSHAQSTPSRAQSKERVLIEFPTALLKRADEAARSLETSRSDLIRSAVERILDQMESREFEQDLAKAYAANSDMNRALTEEFEAVDREGF